jgi:hypothetical protein
METVTTKSGKTYITNPENNEKIEIPVIIKTLTSTTETGSTTHVFAYTTENLHI